MLETVAQLLRREVFGRKPHESDAMREMPIQEEPHIGYDISRYSSRDDYSSFGTSY